MAGSGMGPQNHDGGWISGSSSWYDRHKERKAKFLADHPEWSISFVRSMDRYEASTGDTDTELIIMQDKALGALMDRLEARYKTPDENQETQVKRDNVETHH